MEALRALAWGVPQIASCLIGEVVKCDVAIIGGGPAGATVGCLLKKYAPSIDVAIVERSKFPRDHVGESQLPAIPRILDEMGVWDKVEAAGFPIKIGGTYRWGSTDELWNLSFLPGQEFTETERPGCYRGQRLETAFQVDRSIYDKILLDHARDLGCRVYEEMPVAKVIAKDDAVVGLETKPSHAHLDESSKSGNRVEASHYVDCSGDAGVLRKAFQVEIDSPTALRNIAVWDYWQDAEWAISLGNGGTLIQIMSLGWGWLWFIPITRTRTSVGLVLPAAHFKSSGKSKEQIYFEAIDQEPLISQLLKKARSEGKIQATRDWSFVSKRMCGENWFLAGDSCGFADPILSAGMTLAHSSGRKVAFTILELMRGQTDPHWLRSEYSKGHASQIRHHMMFADFWYSSNGRFTDLKEYCSEIAATAGVQLNPDEAFRWLGTGGFAIEEPGTARALSYRVGGIKYIAQQLGGSQFSWEITKTNMWMLKLSGAAEELFANYNQGTVTALQCYRRDDKLLPVTGIYRWVLEALKRDVDAYRVIESSVQAMIAEGGYTLETALPLAGEAVEALIAEGWVKARVNPNRPFITIS